MDIVTQLRNAALISARVSQDMAAAKTARNRARGELTANYVGGEPSDMLEWKAADEIERLRKINDINTATIRHQMKMNADLLVAAERAGVQVDN